MYRSYSVSRILLMAISFLFLLIMSLGTVDVNRTTSSERIAQATFELLRLLKKFTPLKGKRLNFTENVRL